MALLQRALAMLMLVTLLQTIQSAVYKVGDSAGWTTIGNVDYKQWAAAKTFHVGDVILFEYNSQFHNVMRATHAVYKACNTTAPLATYTTGNDSIKITTRGHHYFFCGVPGHCQAGQKVDINVLRTSVMAPTPAATVAPSASVVPSIKSPGPSPNTAVPLNSLKNPLQILGFGLAMAVSAILFLPM